MSDDFASKPDKVNGPSVVNRPDPVEVAFSPEMENMDTPIERMPADVLHIIFQEGIEELDHLARVQHSVSIASVSRTWRVVAEDIPSLWSTIYISSVHSPSISTIESLLRRSRTHNIDIFIDWGHVPEWEDANAEVASYMLSTTALLKQHLPRWRSLDIEWILDNLSMEIKIKLALFLQGTADSLEELRSRSVYFLNFDLSAPRLRILKMPYLHINVEALVAKAFPALEDLTWSDMSLYRWNHAMFFLQMMQPVAGRLRRLEVCNACVLESFDLAVHPPVSFPALEELELAGIRDGATPERILQVIHAPKLKLLKIHQELIDMSPVRFEDHIIRFPSLHTVRFEVSRNRYWNSGMNSVEDNWASFEPLSAIQLIFGANEDRIMHSILCALRAGQTDGWRYPSLASIILYCAKPAAVPYAPVDLLRQVVQSRNKASDAQSPPGVRKLDTVQVYTSMHISRKDREWFQQNLRQFSWTLGRPPWDVDPDRFPGGYSAIGLVNHDRLLA